jgi:GNAT superfamily N-acetyltransferase
MTSRGSPHFELATGSAVSAADAERVRQGVRDHSASVLGEADFAALHVYARDARGELVGGLVGGTYWGWLHVESLWVRDAHRHRGVGTRLLQLAEAEAVKRGCASVYLDTFSFQARPFYEKLGYRCVGTAPDFPSGHERYFMVKPLERDGPAR